MDQELRETLNEFAKAIDGRFDSMERRIEGRFDSMERRIDGRFESLEGRFESLEGRFESLEGRFESLEGRVDSLEGRFQSIERQLQEFRAEAAQRFDRVETGLRHTNVLVEDLRGQIQLVAEGVANTNERLDRLEEKVDRGFAEERATRTLNEGELERRLRVVEKPKD